MIGALALAAAMQFPNWRHPAWGSTPAEVAAKMPGLSADDGEAKQDIAGMDAKVRGPFAYGAYAAEAKFFFKSDRLALIALKFERPQSCPDLDLLLASNLGRPLVFHHFDSGIFVDAWDDRRGDRVTLTGGPGKAAYCRLSIGPPRRDQFNTH